MGSKPRELAFLFPSASTMKTRKPLIVNISRFFFVARAVRSVSTAHSLLDKHVVTGPQLFSQFVVAAGHRSLSCFCVFAPCFVCLCLFLGLFGGLCEHSASSGSPFAACIVVVVALGPNRACLQQPFSWPVFFPFLPRRTVFFPCGDFASSLQRKQHCYRGRLP